MIIVMKPSALPQDVDKIVDAVEKEGLKTHLSHGEEVTIIGVVGDKTKLDIQRIEASPEVEKVVPITESYKLANKKFHPQPTSFKVKDTVIGPDTMTIMAGTASLHCPCSQEGWSNHSSWWCLQASYFPILFPGSRGRRFKIYEDRFG